MEQEVHLGSLSTSSSEDSSQPVTHVLVEDEVRNRKKGIPGDVEDVDSGWWFLAKLTATGKEAQPQPTLFHRLLFGTFCEPSYTKLATEEQNKPVADREMRGDIQCLRALAVTLVVIYHLGNTWVKGMNEQFSADEF